MENKHDLIVGAYTEGCPDAGLYIYGLDLETLDTALKGKADTVVNPSFLSIDKARGHLFCVSENGQDSMVSTFMYQENGELLNTGKVMAGGEAHAISRTATPTLWSPTTIADPLPFLKDAWTVHSPKRYR